MNRFRWHQHISMIVRNFKFSTSVQRKRFQAPLLKQFRPHSFQKTLQKETIQKSSLWTKIFKKKPFNMIAWIAINLKDNPKNAMEPAVCSLKRSNARWLTPMLPYMEKQSSLKTTSAITIIISKTMRFKIKNRMGILSYCPISFTPKSRRERSQSNGTKNPSS